MASFSTTKAVFILMTIAFVGLTYVGKIDAKDFYAVYGMIVSFYFGQKVNKPSS